MKEGSKYFAPELMHVSIRIKELFQKSDESATMKIVEYLQQNLPDLKAFVDKSILKCVESYSK